MVDLHWGVLFCGSGGGGRVEKMETTRNSEVKGLMAGWLEKFWSRGGGGGGEGECKSAASSRPRSRSSSFAL